jgi:hypothetical protein
LDIKGSEDEKMTDDLEAAMHKMEKFLVFVTLAGVVSAPVEAHSPARLPLGDGKISQAPKRGYVFTCGSTFPGRGGATRQGPWITGDSWLPGQKPVVEGAVHWPNAAISIAVERSERVIRANSLPDHVTGEFPIRPGSRAFEYDRNPNHIGVRDVLLRLPADPKAAAQPGCVPMGMVGFATSGVAIFNAIDLQGRDAPAHEVQDSCKGHPEVTSQYHYHDWSPCLAQKDPDEPVGWMLDGFPILAPEDASGRVFTNADLDECHGRVGVVRLGGREVRMYHYRFTYEYPYTIGCFKGAVDGRTLPGRPPQ